MDEKARRAEELLAERSRTRTNGHPVPPSEAPDAEAPAVPPEDPKIAELTNDLKRMTADFANYRKRNEADRAEYVKFAKADLIGRILDVLDGFDRALASIPEETRGTSWMEGIWLVERKLRGILEAEGLRPVESLGQQFDPYQHEAVAHVPSDQPEGTVIEEHQKAYRLHDKVIRPALVTVSSGSESKEQRNG